MSYHILLGIKVDIGSIKNIKIENINLDSEVKNLKEEASKQSNNSADSLELIYHGQVLDETKNLKDYGIKSGEMVHVFKKVLSVEKPVVESKNQLTAESINLLFRTYGLPTRSVTSFSNAMEIICEASSIEKILELEPEMANDPVGLSYLTVPELIYHLQDFDTYDNIVKNHPLLVPTFVKVIKNQMQSTGRGHNTITGMQVDSDEDYDGEGEDGEGEEEEEAGGGLITPEQLSAALAMAGAAAGSSSTGGNGAGTSSTQDTGFRDFLGSLLGPQTTAATSRPLITTDMFSNALSQAIISAATNNSDSPSVASPSASNSIPEAAVSSSDNSAGRDYTTQLTNMSEMGLVDHRANLRALIICSGDVTAAINLILSGAIED